MSSGEAKGRCVHSMSLPIFPKNSSVAFRSVANLNPQVSPQGEAPGQLSGPFSCTDWGCYFSVLSAAQICLSYCYRPLRSKSTSPLTTRARQSRGLLHVNCTPTGFNKAVVACDFIESRKKCWEQVCLQY